MNTKAKNMKTTHKKQKQHYVDNQEFLAAIVEYKRKVRVAALKENPDITPEELKKVE